MNASDTGNGAPCCESNLKLVPHVGQLWCRRQPVGAVHIPVPLCNSDHYQHLWVLCTSPPTPCTDKGEHKWGRVEMCCGIFICPLVNVAHISASALRQGHW